MKMPDLSKKALGSFFLHHTEKLILGLCLILFGLFFWLGFKAKPFEDSTPKKLVSLADGADSYINSPDSWDKIKEHRQGKKGVLEEIEKAEGEGQLDPSQYTIELVSGIAARTLEPRSDPRVIAPANTRAVCIDAPLLIAMNQQFTDPYSELKLVEPEEGAGGGGFGGGLGGGPGGFGGGLDGDEDPGDDEESAEDEFDGDDGPGGFGGGRGGGLGGPGGGAAAVADDEDTVPEIDAGTQMLRVHADTFDGVLPMTHSISATTTKPWLLKVVCVTATIDFSKQLAEFDKFPGLIGYYPDRDKPIYQHVEVQRRVKGSDKWIDRTEWIQYQLPQKYPGMHKMPKAFNASAPEVVGAEHWDPVTTGPIPPFAMVDYTKLVTHPMLDKFREFPELEIEETKEAGVEDVFGGEKAPAAGGLGAGGLGGGGGRGMGGPGMGGPGLGGGMGGGLGGPGLGGGMGGGLGGPGLGGGMGGGLGGSRGGGMGGGLGGEMGDEIKQTRSGSDFTDYINELDAKKPKSKLKLVRFFDVDPTQNGFAPGKVYEYRMRVWMGDPNNEDPAMQFVNAQGAANKAAGGLGGGRGGFGMGSDEEDDYGDEEDEEGNDLGGPPSQGGDEAKEKTYVKTPIRSTMLVPDVRKRINNMTEVEDPKTKEPRYTITEFRTVKEKNAEGVEVEKVVEEKTLIPSNRAYLRFARPSAWSEPAEVEITADSSMIAAGGSKKGKTVKLKINDVDVLFPVGEPVSELMAATWSADYGTAVPTKQTVGRGELMNYFTAGHIVNPITWRVYVTKNENELAEDEDKYRVPIKTNKVLVDLMGGEELPTPRGEKMRHNLASEILVMDSKGNFTVQNDMEDRTTYRNFLLEPIESQSVGKAKKKKKKDRAGGPGGGRGGFGGGLGGFDPDDQ